ncbi:transglycosylase family protein [Streptomyces sp. NPDC087294]|uniref:transglycosylase family protein n=1 Tax=Streptomyces sp. NPDC087294 TaxID=3365777 RepID=UPI0037F6183D
MLSGNGRHRRPRQAPALLVAAGVTGTAIAIPLLAASGASAADGTTWDKVAQCATGGSWSQNTGNGSYGGLQLSQEDWEAYGGLDFASSPDLASRNQQIAVAEKVLADQGVGAFHTCGLTSGLTQESGSVDIDTGLGDDASGTSDGSGSTGLSNSSGDGSSDSDSSSSSDPSDSDSATSPSPSTSVDDKGDQSDKGDAAGKGISGTPSASSPEEKAPASPTESPTESPTGDASDNSRQSAGSWSLVDTGAVSGSDAGTKTASGTGKHRGQSAEESGTRSVAADRYTVRAGDTLGTIADSLGLDGGWRALYDLNKKDIGADPSRIVPGQTLKVGS